MLRTFLLIAALTALFMAIGFMVGGPGGMKIAFVMAAVMNFGAYWFSDKMVLRMYGAKPADPQEHKNLYQMVERMTQAAKLPMPKLYIMQNPQPNAFATGRNASHAALAVTTGLLDSLKEDETEAVLGHEIAHIRNGDMLIMTITATLAGAISTLANMAAFGGSRENRNPIVMILLLVLAPLAAMLVQLAISRTREYQADRVGSFISGKPLLLASALKKISETVKKVPNHVAEEHPATAHLFIMNPLTKKGFDNLFSTHPLTENRVLALQEQAKEMGSDKNG